MKTEKDIKYYIEFLEDYLRSKDISDANKEKIEMKLEVLRWVVSD